MKQKLFENVNGNQFKLITEAVDNNTSKTTLVREGLKKVLSAGSSKITYTVLESVGLGYIKNVSEAKKCAIQEARSLANEFGYTDDENTQTFVKEQNWAGLGDDEERWEGPLANKNTKTSEIPGKKSNVHSDAGKEAEEVRIAKEILNRVKTLRTDPNPNRIEQMTFEIEKLANELIQMHS